MPCHQPAAPAQGQLSLGTQPSEEGSEGEGSVAGKEGGPERTDDSTRVTQQGDAEPISVAFPPLRARSPNFPRQASPASFTAVDLTCPGDGRRAGKGWSERRAESPSVSPSYSQPRPHKGPLRLASFPTTRQRGEKAMGKWGSPRGRDHGEPRRF